MKIKKNQWNELNQSNQKYLHLKCWKLKKNQLKWIESIKSKKFALKMLKIQKKINNNELNWPNQN